MNTADKLKKYKALVLVCLSTCAFIYIFYRPEGSLINIFLNLFLPDTFLAYKETVRIILPLHEAIIYSLPGGLWVFSATIVARNLRLNIFSKVINLEWLPMTFALWLELLQYFSLVKGRFDWVDVLFVLLFGFLAKYFFNKRYTGHTSLNTFNQQGWAFTLVFLCVFMAHVF